MVFGSPTFFWEGAALTLLNFEFCLPYIGLSNTIRIGSIVKVNYFCVRLRTTSYIDSMCSSQCSI